MAMLLRTKRTKLALVFRVVCVLGITVTYLFIGALSRGIKQSNSNPEGKNFFF